MATESLPTPAAASSPSGPRQEEMPLALVHGQPMLQMPQDLYIPPDALEVILEAFEGPLDLLLYLIRRQNLDILDIPVARITEQYVEYISVMQELRYELAAEYLVMAAILAEIKSRLLLPRPALDDDEEEDPRAELVRRLQEYERFKKAAEDLDTLPRMERDTALATAWTPELRSIRKPPEVDLRELLAALVDMLARAELHARHAVQREPLSVRQRMSRILTTLANGAFHDFLELFSVEEGRAGIVVTLLAILELAREGLLEIVQEVQFAPIYLRSLAVLTADGQDDPEGPARAADGDGDVAVFEEV